jgi:hypothetical protein
VSSSIGVGDWGRLARPLLVFAGALLLEVYKSIKFPSAYRIYDALFVVFRPFYAPPMNADSKARLRSISDLIAKLLNEVRVLREYKHWEDD